MDEVPYSVKKKRSLLSLPYCVVRNWSPPPEEEQAVGSGRHGHQGGDEGGR